VQGSIFESQKSGKISVPNRSYFSPIIIIILGYFLRNVLVLLRSNIFCDLKPLNQHSAKVMKCFELADIDVFGSLKH